MRLTALLAPPLAADAAAWRGLAAWVMGLRATDSAGLRAEGLADAALGADAADGAFDAFLARGCSVVRRVLAAAWVLTAGLALTAGWALAGVDLALVGDGVDTFLEGAAVFTDALAVLRVAFLAGVFTSCLLARPADGAAGLGPLMAEGPQRGLAALAAGPSGAGPW